LQCFFFSRFSISRNRLFFLLKKQNPETDPIFSINSFLGIYFAVDLLIRYFFQAIPVTEVKQLLLLPITKRVIIRGVIVRSLGSIFNALPLVVLLPFCIVHSVENGMTYSIWIWFLSIICLSLSNNYLTFLINKSNKIADVFLGFFAIGYILDYFFNFSISHYFGLVFVGLSGVIFQKQLLNVIVKTYKKKKYQTVKSFNK
jgi:hypothetical protein